MGRVLKLFAVALVGILALIVIAAIVFVLLFDPNNFREEIAESVETATGREFSIEGDIELSVFPWVAIEIGKTTLGNAEGFGDEPFAQFERARLSVRLMPLIFGQDVSIGTAELDSLSINLAVNESGRSNWQDFSERAELAEQAKAQAPEAVEAAEAASPAGEIDISKVDIKNASLTYRNAQLGDEYTLSDLRIQTGDVGAGQPIDLDGGFRFSAEPAGVAGEIDIETTIDFAGEDAKIEFSGLAVRGSAEGVADVPVTVAFEAPAVVLRTEDRVAEVGDLRFEFLDVVLNASVTPFSYADSPKPTATIAIDAFSPRTLMEQLGIEPPPTADPNAFGKLMVDAKAAVSDDTISLSDLELVFDDTTFKGELVVPRDSNGTYRLNLAGDRIDATRYMAPATEEQADAPADAAVPVEIPVDLIRAVNAKGSLTLDEGRLGKMEFGNVELGVDANNGNVRFYPITAEFFDGSYAGDTRIDATGDQAVLTVDERIEGVSLAPFAKAMFDRDNITGQINGRFQLSGRGNDMAAVQRTLSGKMSFVLSDGAFEGTDIWYQLRRTRAAFRQEPPPEPVLPARTRFSEVSATGNVTDGVLRNDDFSATLPFMQLVGKGSVNFVAATVDYSLSGRVLDKPELVDAATPEEIDDLTQVAIPLKITGPLSDPSIGIDFEEMLKDRAQEEIEDVVKDKLKDLFNR